MDATGYMFVTTSNKDRIPLAVVSIGTMMRQVSNGDFRIQWYGDGYEPLLHYLSLIAAATKNKVTLNRIPDTMSVAHSKTNLFVPRDLTHFVNLDDDLLLHPVTAFYLNRMRNADVATVGVVDPVNVRQFADWDDTVYLNLASYHAAGKELSKAKHHYFRTSVTIKYNWISQFYVLSADAYRDRRLWDPIHQKFAQKGVRGYDILLESLLPQFGYEIQYTTGVEALHLGLENGFLNDKWTSKNEVVDTVVKHVQA